MRKHEPLAQAVPSDGICDRCSESFEASELGDCEACWLFLCDDCRADGGHECEPESA